MLNELAKDIHELAVSKGWWEKERDFGEIIALCHGELSEALEEYRNNKPMLYYKDFAGLGVEIEKSEKPEGIAVELADTIIRIFDYCGKHDVDVDELIEQGDIRFTKLNVELPQLVAHCHWQLSQAYEQYLDCLDNIFEWLINCVYIILKWCELQGINILDMVRIKHEYNKTRPYRHGNKRI